MCYICRGFFSFLRHISCTLYTCTVCMVVACMAATTDVTFGTVSCTLSWTYLRYSLLDLPERLSLDLPERLSGKSVGLTSSVTNSANFCKVERACKGIAMDLVTIKGKSFVYREMDRDRGDR